MELLLSENGFGTEALSCPGPSGGALAVTLNSPGSTLELVSSFLRNSGTVAPLATLSLPMLSVARIAQCSFTDNFGVGNNSAAVLQVQLAAGSQALISDCIFARNRNINGRD